MLGWVRERRATSKLGMEMRKSRNIQNGEKYPMAGFQSEAGLNLGEKMHKSRFPITTVGWT